ncbi:Amino-terminal enhancer of split, partial [Camelus dromedarius]
LKTECDKLASEKSEMQLHYVIEASTPPPGLRELKSSRAEWDMCPGPSHLSQEVEWSPQPYVGILAGVEGGREGQRWLTLPFLCPCKQQLQAHPLSQLQALALPLTPPACGAAAPSLPAVSAGTGLLLSVALGSRPTSPRKTRTGMTVTTHQEDDGENRD